jgi:hypothetical protein
MDKTTGTGGKGGDSRGDRKPLIKVETRRSKESNFKLKKMLQPKRTKYRKVQKVK